MMAKMDEVGGGQQRRWTTTAREIVQRTMMGKEERGQQEMAEIVEWQ
jgi:hypothetical protein